MSLKVQHHLWGQPLKFGARYWASVYAVRIEVTVLKKKSCQRIWFQVLRKCIASARGDGVGANTCGSSKLCCIAAKIGGLYTTLSRQEPQRRLGPMLRSFCPKLGGKAFLSKSFWTRLTSKTKKSSQLKRSALMKTSIFCWGLKIVTRTRKLCLIVPFLCLRPTSRRYKNLIKNQNSTSPRNCKVSPKSKVLLCCPLNLSNLCPTKCISQLSVRRRKRMSNQTSCDTWRKKHSTKLTKSLHWKYDPIPFETRCTCSLPTKASICKICSCSKSTISTSSSSNSTRCSLKLCFRDNPSSTTISGLFEIWANLDFALITVHDNLLPQI